MAVVMVDMCVNSVSLHMCFSIVSFVSQWIFPHCYVCSLVEVLFLLRKYCIMSVFYGKMTVQELSVQTAILKV